MDEIGAGGLSKAENQIRTAGEGGQEPIKIPKNYASCAIVPTTEMKRQKGKVCRYVCMSTSDVPCGLRSVRLKKWIKNNSD